MTGQENEIVELRVNLSEQAQHFDRLQEQIDRLIDQVSRQQEEIGKLNKSNTPLDAEPLNWQCKFNVKIDVPNILEVDDSTTFAFAQSDKYLEPTKSSFKIHLSALKRNKLNWFGLTCKGHPISERPEDESIIYYSTGLVTPAEDDVFVASEWEDGDTIECGIKFPSNFINDGQHKAPVYFQRNEEVMFKKSFKIPCDGLFPTICFSGSDVKIKCSDIIEFF